MACGGSSLPKPTYVAHPADAGALEQVNYPPPPARVEFIPEQPRDDAVWIDGEWQWQGTRWGWKPGRWVVPPTNASYSPWTTVRDRDGNLYAAAGKWRDSSGAEIADPPAIAVARTRGGPVVDPEGESVGATRNVPAVAPAGGGAAKANAKGEADDAGAPETPSGATPTGTETKSAPAADGGGP